MTEVPPPVPPTPTPPAPLTPRPLLRRSDSDRVVAGVAGGIGRWLSIDPVIVRVLFAVLAVFGGSGLLLYGIGWLFIPSDSATTSEAENFIERTRHRSGIMRFLLFVALGIVALVLIANLNGPFGHWGGGGAIALLVVVAAVGLYVVSRTATPQLPKTVEAPAPLNTDQTGFAATEPEFSDAAPMASAAELLPPPDPATAFAYGGAGTYPGYVPEPAPVVVAAPRPPRHRSYLGLLTLSIAIIVGGVLTTLAWAGNANIAPVAILGVMLAVLGAGLLVGGFVGRSKWLTFLAVPLLFLTMLASLLPSNLNTKLSYGTGQRYWTPTTVVEASTPYHLSVGTAQLDLGQLVIPKGITQVNVSATVEFGALDVFVPRTARVFIDAKVGLGRINIMGSFSPDSYRSGRNISFNGAFDGNPKTGPIINIHLNSSIGRVEVSRA